MKLVGSVEPTRVPLQGEEQVALSWSNRPDGIHIVAKPNQHLPFHSRKRVAAAAAALPPSKHVAASGTLEEDPGAASLRPGAGRCAFPQMGPGTLRLRPEQRHVAAACYLRARHCCGVRALPQGRFHSMRSRRAQAQACTWLRRPRSVRWTPVPPCPSPVQVGAQFSR